MSKSYTPVEHQELLKCLRAPHTAYSKISELRAVMNEAADAIEALLSLPSETATASPLSAIAEAVRLCEAEVQRHQEAARAFRRHPQKPTAARDADQRASGARDCLCFIQDLQARALSAPVTETGAWIDVGTNPDFDGKLWPVTIEKDGELKMDFEYYHFIDGWATDEHVIAWWNRPVLPVTGEHRFRSKS